MAARVVTGLVALAATALAVVAVPFAMMIALWAGAVHEQGESLLPIVLFWVWSAGMVVAAGLSVAGFVTSFRADPRRPWVLTGSAVAVLLVCAALVGVWALTTS